MAASAAAAGWLLTAWLARDAVDAPLAVPLLVVAAAWLATAVLTLGPRSVASLAALVALTWVLPLVVPSALLWHRAVLVHLLLSGSSWWPRTWPARTVVACGYVSAVLAWPWTWVWSTLCLAVALLVGAALERGAAPVSVLRLAPWRWALGVTVLAFTAPVVLAQVGLGRAWASPVLFSYAGALTAVAALVVLATRPAAPPWATDLAVDLESPPRELLERALATRSGDPAEVRREAATALRAAARLRDSLAARQAELTLALEATERSRLRLRSADSQERHDLRTELDRVAVRRLEAAAALLAAEVGTAAGGAPSGPDHATPGAPGATGCGAADDPVREEADDAVGCAWRALAHLRTAVADLDALGAGLAPPVLDEGTVAALRRLAQTSAVPVEEHLPDADRAATLPEAVRSCLYYVASEALANVAKHAHATGVRLSLRVDDDDVELELVDDGAGGVGEEGGTGVAGMQERVTQLGGSLTVGPAPDGGTAVRLLIPLGGTLGPQVARTAAARVRSGS